MWGPSNCEQTLYPTQDRVKDQLFSVDNSSLQCPDSCLTATSLWFLVAIDSKVGTSQGSVRKKELFVALIIYFNLTGLFVLVYLSVQSQLSSCFKEKLQNYFFTNSFPLCFQYCHGFSLKKKKSSLAFHCALGKGRGNHVCIFYTLELKVSHTHFLKNIIVSMEIVLLKQLVFWKLPLCKFLI